MSLFSIDFLCTPARLQSISRSRRVIQTLGTIVKTRQLEYYYQAVYLLQFLHNLYPNVIPVQNYGQLLVYLKVEVNSFLSTFNSKNYCYIDILHAPLLPDNLLLFMIKIIKNSTNRLLPCLLQAQRQVHTLYTKM